MKFARRPHIVVVAAYLAAVFGFAGGVWWYGYGAALGSLEQRARADLALASDSLTGELRRFRELAVLTSDHPQVRAALTGDTHADDVQQVLQEIADKTGALDIMLIGPTGENLLATQGAPAGGHRATDYFERAMDGAIGFSFSYSQSYARRTFIFATPVFSDAGPVVGVLLVYADANAVESVWRGARPALFFTDDQGVVFLSNRSELIFRVQGALPNLRERYPQLSEFVGYQSQMIGGVEVWQVDGGRYLPQNALHLTLDLPIIGMTGEVLVDVAPARQLAALQAAVVAVVCLAFGLLLFFATLRRRTLAALNVRLERRVRDRTAELRAVNANLRNEIIERTATETRLKKAQDDLVQAGKLAALGQMSAGISHELNQPLTAIRSFAENAQGFLDRGKTDVAEQNLGRISELARRMGRIISNLRAFARQEVEPPKDVDIVAVVDAVLEIVTPRASQDQIAVNWTRPGNRMIVRGGEVRLQQVILNLVSNGMDAMEDSPQKAITIAIEATDNRTKVSVRDTGPGITEPERIFDPFYTTKAVGAAEGMGLGLSISYGLVQSFGGMIRGRNHPQGGAVFTVELDSVPQKETR
ncbi:ATP-binding protein [Yoonia sp. I 8.24]|uniref:sensor histidine kinase n=1 Tax=Yoonia sp. I 8.24 TaxID=1537229 RepID=UPI001EDEA837|nr:ATP-binding protein [Yoonia sp. I 8.24]MCG3267456.1 sensor histidine kinase [Yoonia sp. I 8.24]